MESRYEEAWEINDERWNAQCHKSLHEAGFLIQNIIIIINKYAMDLKMKEGSYDTIERMTLT